MKSKLSFLAILLLTFGAILLTFQNCSPQQSQSGLLAVAEAGGIGRIASFGTSGVASHLKYFGFFADGMEHEGSGNYIGETSKVANIHFISADSLDALTPKLQAAAAAGNQVIIMTEGMLFEWKVKRSAKLQAGYKTNIQNLKSYLLRNGFIGIVKGFYVMDEPYYVNSDSDQKLSEAEVYANLELGAAELIKNFGPTLIVSTEAFPTIDQYIATGKWLGFPANFNWLAFNCYLAYDAVCDTEVKYEDYIKAMKSALKPNQELFFTLDNYSNINVDLKEMEKRLMARTQFQLELALKYNSPALVSFMYQGAADRLALQNYPALKGFVYNLAVSVTGKSLTAAPSPVGSPAPSSAPIPSPAPAPPQAAAPVPGSSPTLVPGSTPAHAPDPTDAVLVSNSLSDNFVSGGTVCNTGEIYTRILGRFDSIGTTKVCAAKRGTSGCNLVTADAFVPFKPEQHLNSSTMQMVSNAADYPAGDYDVFTQEIFTMPYGGIKHVGGFTVRDCRASAPPPVVPSAVCLNLEPKCEGANYVRRDSCGQIVGIWKLAPICTWVHCEGPDYVRRDSVDQIVEVWKNAELCRPQPPPQQVLSPGDTGS